MKSLLCLSGLFVSFLVSSVVEAAPALADQIQPRANGANWVYTSYLYEDGLRKPGGTTKEEVLEVKALDGETCYLVKLTMDWRTLAERLSGVELPEEDYSFFWEYTNEAGSFKFTPDDVLPDNLKSLDRFEILLPYPAEIGYTYISEGDNYEIIDNDFSVSVTAGDFKCSVYQVTYLYEDAPQDSTRERLYVSPGVGLIRWEMDAYVDREWVLEMRDDLFRYDLKLAE
ncbi:MAG: hypothetical protein ACSHYA_05780 [Opitutaceae bacterium]